MSRKYGKSRHFDRSRDNFSSSSLDEAAEQAEEYFREHGKVPERPRNLRGKEIGLWYSRMSKLKKDSPDAKKTVYPVGDVTLTRDQRNDIQTVLDSFQDKMTKPPDGSSTSYIRDSEFKRDYIQNIKGNIEDNMAKISELKQDEELDEVLFDELKSKNANSNYRLMLKKRENLPSYKVKEKIIEMVDSSQVVLISGETGCGKTTQVPQFLLDHFIKNKKGSVCKIVCTQPRRISAISVAERVAAERAEKLGNSTGYKIRLEDVRPRERGSLIFCTTGVVLRQMQRDPCLSEYTHVILDEIHERDIQTDFLLTLLKQVITKRTNLRVILMSATLNAESFSKYFGNCPHLNIPGFTYHVEEYFLEDVLQRTNFQFEQFPRNDNFHRNRKSIKAKEREFEEIIEPYIKKLRRENKYSSRVIQQLSNPISEVLNLTLVLNLLKDICQNEKDQGGVLIFLPGYADISDLIKMIDSSGNFPRSKFFVIPLHSQLPTVEQRHIFSVPPSGVRKIVISTNIAETSITIDDIVFVIDSARIKISHYDVQTNSQTLEALWVAKANASQRKGRAGRVKPGVCFHLITRARYQKLEPYIVPEILRSRLENVVLTAKLLQLGKIEEFFPKLMDSPNPEVVSKSLELLSLMEALDENESLTPLGYHLAKLPMHPQIGKMILFGAFFNCLDPILNIAVTLDYKDAYLIPMGKEKDADRRRKELAGSCQSDHLYMHKLINDFESLYEAEKRKFCWTNFLSYSTMKQLVKLKDDFMKNLFDMNFVPNTNSKCEECNCNSEKMDVVRAVICAGLYPNILRIVTRVRKKSVTSLYLLTGEKAKLHPKSVLNEEYISNKLLVYYRIIKSSSLFVHDATTVDAFPVIFFGNNFQQVRDKDDHFITINNLLKFKSNPNTSKVIKDLRNKLNNLLEYKISHPSAVDLRIENEESAFFRAIIELLCNSSEIEFENFVDAL